MGEGPQLAEQVGTLTSGSLFSLGSEAAKPMQMESYK